MVMFICHLSTLGAQTHILHATSFHRVMFAGNPRICGSLSFEKIRHALDDEGIMSRLRDSWLNPQKQLSLQQPNAQWNDEMVYDEWIITHLSSDEMTGIRQEVDVLVSLGILNVTTNGKIVLADKWVDRVPHMILNEMKDYWGSELDVHNLFCIHDRIKLPLERKLASSEDDDEEEEYQMRKQIFTENYQNWVNERSGVGIFNIEA